MNDRRTRKDFTFKQLSCLADVCRLGGYAAAAREQKLTTSAVWEQIKRLEQHFAVRLLERSGGTVRPTPRGRRLLELVSPYLTGLETTCDSFHQEGELYPEQLTVVSQLRVAVEQIAQGMASFQRQFPSVRLRFRDTTTDRIQELVLNHSADLAITLQPAVPFSKLLTFEPMGELDILLMTPQQHKLAKVRKLQLESIAEYPLVLAERGTYSRHCVEEVFHRHDLIRKLDVAAETPSDVYTPGFVNAGLGIGIGVGIPSGFLYKDLAVRSLERWFGTIRIGFLWRRGTTVPPLQQILANQLREKLAQGRLFKR